MKVKLINNTLEALETMYIACKTCYSANDAITIFNEVTNNDKEVMLKLVLKVLRSGHLSIAEHINFTFAIDGISRICSHQLVRHRHAVYSQKSQRYVTHKPFKFVLPFTITQHERKNTQWESFKSNYIELMKECQHLYSRMLEEGIPAEDVRYIFPNACETSLVMTCNLREFMHICNLRLCLQAQWEIRCLVEEMKQEVISVYPWMLEFLVSKCENCTEYKKCERKNENKN